MADPLKALLESGLVAPTRFEPSSRYAGSEVKAYDPGDGSPPMPYVGRRLVPDPDSHALQREVTVIEGDRRDTLSDRHVGDAAMWWLLADANGVVDPRELTDRPGRRVRITGPEGSAAEEEP